VNRDQREAVWCEFEPCISDSLGRTVDEAGTDVRHVVLVLVSLLAVDTVMAQQDRMVLPIYVPPETDPGMPGGHGTFEGRSYHVMRYRQHYGVTFHPGLPQDQPTVVRAMAKLCHTVAKFDVRGVAPHTTSPPSDDTWVFETRTGLCMGAVFRSTDPHSTVVSIWRLPFPAPSPPQTPRDEPD
jgi:hypothetical protein